MQKTRRAQFKEFTRREEWRSWLKKNHHKSDQLWVVFTKKGMGKQTFSYEEAVEEALCFGWIDSILKRIDDVKYAQKFTPRRNPTKWSQRNIERVKKLMSEGKMTKAGVSKLGDGIFTSAPVQRPPRSLPSHLERLIKRNSDAWTNFNALAPSYRRQYIGWILAAKKAETQMKRVMEAIEKLKRGQRLELK